MRENNTNCLTEGKDGRHAWCIWTQEPMGTLAEQECLQVKNKSNWSQISDYLWLCHVLAAWLCVTYLTFPSLDFMIHFMLWLLELFWVLNTWQERHFIKQRMMVTVVCVSIGVSSSHLDLCGRLAINLLFGYYNQTQNILSQQGNPLMFKNLVIITPGVKESFLCTVLGCWCSLHLCLPLSCSCSFT